MHSVNKENEDCKCTASSGELAMAAGDTVTAAEERLGEFQDVALGAGAPGNQCVIRKYTVSAKRKATGSGMETGKTQGLQWCPYPYYGNTQTICLGM